MSYYDDDLRFSLKESGVKYEVLSDEMHDKFLMRINSQFKFSGGKIAWQSVTNRFFYFGDGLNDGLEEIAKKLSNAPFGYVFCIGDSLTDCAYKFCAKDMSRVFSVFSEIPQHTYFFSEDISWISCLSMEGMYEGVLLSDT